MPQAFDLARLLDANHAPIGRSAEMAVSYHRNLETQLVVCEIHTCALRAEEHRWESYVTDADAVRFWSAGSIPAVETIMFFHQVPWVEHHRALV
jgi:hypothetical protein